MAIAPTCPTSGVGRGVSRPRLVMALVALAGLSLSLPAVAQEAEPEPAAEGEGSAELAEGLEPSVSVIELYMAEKDYDKTPFYAVRVSDELGEVGGFAILSRDDAERQLRAIMTSSGRRITDEKLAEIEDMLRQGDELVYTNPRKAIEILDEAKRELQAIMESISLNQKLRKDFFTTQMLLARSHHDNGNKAKASEIMEEIIRVFGDEWKVTEEDYHPDIVALYRESYRRLSEMRTGTLKVVTEPPGSEVLINGKLQDKPSPATYEGLYPGQVTVSARKDGRESLVHKVQVSLEAPGEINIDIDYETSVAFDDRRFGFVFPDQATLDKRIADFAARIGEKLNVEFILVTGLVERENRTFLDGYLVNVAERKIERSNSFYTKANVVSNNRVREMAAFIGAKEYVPPPPETLPWYTNWLGWGLVGAGAVSAAVALPFYFQFLDEGTKFETGWIEKTDTRPEGCETYMVTEGGTFYDQECAALWNVRERGNQAGLTSTVLVSVGGALAVGGILAFILWERTEEPDDMASSDPSVIELEYAVPTFNARGDATMQFGFSF